MYILLSIKVDGMLIVLTPMSEQLSRTTWYLVELIFCMAHNLITEKKKSYINLELKIEHKRIQIDRHY